MILDQHAVARLLRMEDLIPAVATALADFSAGRAVMPGRVVVPVADHGGFFGVMPAYAGALGAKLVTWFPNNQGVPTRVRASIPSFLPPRESYPGNYAWDAPGATPPPTPAPAR